VCEKQLGNSEKNFCGLVCGCNTAGKSSSLRKTAWTQREKVFLDRLRLRHAQKIFFGPTTAKRPKNHFRSVVLGGLMREDVQKTEDRTPIIGDIPILGRLFRTNAEQHVKRNLVIFVTARLINPGGQLVNQTEEEEETEDLILPPELPPVPMYKK